MLAAEDSVQAARTLRLAALQRERDLDLLLVSEPVNLRYLTGFTGSNGLALLAAEPDVRPRFFTDFRYATQSAEQLPALYDREIVQLDLLETAARLLAEQGGGGRLGFDEAALSVKQHRRLRELLDEEWELVGAAGLVEGLRELKDAAELERIRAAAQLADEALRGMLEGGLAGRTERDVAIDLELRMRRLGASAPSFSSIVAAGSHSALPHAEARDVEIPRDTLVTIDWGAEHEGYCSDCTRTFATGERLGEQEREIYALVLRAQLAGLDAVRPGPSGREVDAAARAVIESAGHGEHFGHGLGHGVGLEVHEAPRLSRTAAEQPLRAGHVVTVEPGVYVPGQVGVRIEDLVAVTADGHEVLNGLPKELTVVS
ncbi:MAG TPA: Xaa-Pro peptidase family protein [Solirubrobacteraceae bacterium]|jgi:Xaa-Pro aminopeptidase